MLLDILTNCEAVHENMDSRLWTVEGDFALIGLDGWEKLKDVTELAHRYVQRNKVKLGNCVPQSRTNRNGLERTSRRLADPARLLAATAVSMQAIQGLVTLQTAVLVAEQQDVG
jgi:hypothetical protein